MLECENIVKLYNKVLENDIFKYGILEREIRNGIRRMAKVYRPVERKDMDFSVVVDYNNVAHRCAYLHKFASLHTAMVRDFMFSAIRRNYDFFNDWLSSEYPFKFKMCSLGGGPGSDVLGVMASLINTFNNRNNLDFSVTIIDHMAEWRKSFKSVIQELNSGAYGNFGPVFGHSLQWSYLAADLLQTLDPEVKREISSASLITAVKFISAANCKDTEFMVEKIFSAMKPGAIIFFIDNAGGGSREYILDSAVKLNFIPIFGPIEKEYYSNEVVKVKRFRSLSCHKTLVSVAILQKPYEIQPRLRITIPYARGDLFPGSGFSRKVDEDCNSNLSFGFATIPDASIPDIPLVRNELSREDDNACAPIPNAPTPYKFQLYDGYFTLDPTDTADSVFCPENKPYFIPDSLQLDRDRIPKKDGRLLLSKIKHWRHHLSTKLDSFKSRSRNKLERKQNGRSKN